MNEKLLIRRFLRSSAIGTALMAGARGLLRAAPIWIGGIMLLAGLDHWMELSPWGRQAIWILFAIAGAAGFASGFSPARLFTLFERSKNLARRSSSFRPDDLRLAAELSSEIGREGTSDELRGVFLERTAEKLSEANPLWCFPATSWKRPLMLALIVIFTAGSLRAFFPSIMPIEARTLFPFWSFELERKIKIEPGDADVAFGKDASIHLTLLESGGKPVLMVKTGQQWLELEPAMESNKEYFYTIKAVVSPLYYRVGWRGEWSRRFTLTPVRPVAIDSFSIKVTPPDYTGKAAYEQTTPEITGLAGTKIEMTISANAPLDRAALQFSDKHEVVAEKNSGNQALFRFILTTEGTYGFTLTPRGGASMQADAVYPVHVTEDKPPTITLLAPDQDVVIGEKEKLPITYDARDDYGLGEITLMWEVSPGNSKRRQIAAFEKATESSLATYSWDLALQNFPPGQVLRFRIGATDKNKVTGPGEAWSEWRVVEVRSFEREHAMLEKALEAWRDKAVETLAQVTTLQKKVDAENADMNALSKDFNPPQQNLQLLNEALKQILNKMEQDPLADYGVWIEHKAMQENLAELNQTTAKNAQAAFQTQNKQAASENLDSISKELERMTALSEDLSKSQKARDVTQAGENLEQLGEDMMSQMQNSKGDPESIAKINQLLAEAQKNLMEMSQALQEMPQELPDDFVNQQALKNLDLGKSKDILSQISDAMKQGDMKRAMDLAQKFLAAAKAMKSQISKAHDSYLKSTSASELEKKISEQAKALEEVTNQQRQLLAETQKLASKQMDDIMKQQEDLLASLAVRQEKVVAQSREVRALSVLIGPMSSVAAEFKTKRIDKSPDWLSAIVSQVQMIKTQVAASSAAVSDLGTIAKVHDEELAILDLIKNPPAPKQGASAEDQKSYSDLQGRQEGVRKKTQQVKQQLQDLSRKTASLGGKLMQSLGRAGFEMKSAEGQLSDKNGVVAQRSEERALDNLLQGQDALSEAQAAMSDMAMEQGGEMEGGDTPGGHTGGGPKVIFRSGGQGMGRGQQTGKVKLPNADDYRAPKAFREDLMESLKENYPKVYEEIIHNYYKRLAQ